VISATQHNATQHNATQHNATQHNATQHNATQHNATQHYVNAKCVVMLCCPKCLVQFWRQILEIRLEKEGKDGAITFCQLVISSTRHLVNFLSTQCFIKLPIHGMQFHQFPVHYFEVMSICHFVNLLFPQLGILSNC
jgi:hypothetical protein